MNVSKMIVITRVCFYNENNMPSALFIASFTIIYPYLKKQAALKQNHSIIYTLHINNI